MTATPGASSALTDPAFAEVMAAGGVVVEVAPARPHVAIVSLARPGMRNAQSPATWRALATIGEVLLDPDPDPEPGPEAGAGSVRAVLVRGEGPSFSAGLDRRLFTAEGVDGQPGIPSLAALSPDDADARLADYQAGFAWLRDPRLVSVAAVAGHALGAGFQLALACDLRVVAPDASFGMLETALGLVPDLGGTLPLVQAVGRARAVELCLSGRRVGADEALAIGLAQERADTADGVDAAGLALLDRLLAGPAGAVRETLALLDAAADGPDAGDQLAAERAAQLRRIRAMVAGEG